MYRNHSLYIRLFPHFFLMQSINSLLLDQPSHLFSRFISITLFPSLLGPSFDLYMQVCPNLNKLLWTPQSLPLLSYLKSLHIQKSWESGQHLFTSYSLFNYTCKWSSKLQSHETKDENNLQAKSLHSHLNISKLINWESYSILLGRPSLTTPILYLAHLPLQQYHGKT